MAGVTTKQCVQKQRK